MSSDRDRQVMEARELDKMSTVMIDLGVRVAKRNPIKVASYFIGLLICLFVNGYSTTESARSNYNNILRTIDYAKLDRARADLDFASRQYYKSKGWFSCNTDCQVKRETMREYELEHAKLVREEESTVSEAKSALGLFSEFGVGETRELFWTRFSQGKSFATRQSKWDALFMGIQAMGRDENLGSYALRVIMNMLFNFTLGVCGAVVWFLFSVWHLINTYKSSIVSSLAFFSLASLAAIAFALTWLIGIYMATAGTVYVGAKLIASNMRIEGGPDGRRGYNRRVH